MPKRSSKDLNQIAASIVAQSTTEQPQVTVNMIGVTHATPILPPDGKNPAAVALGRLGGLKGGKARAKSLSDARKKEIGKQGAAARWKKKNKLGT